MFGDKRETLSSFSIILAAVVFNGCIATMASKTITHKELVKDPDIHVDVYNPNKAWHGTTLFADNHRNERPRIIEVDMQGRIIWEYVLPLYLRQYNNPGFDVESLPKGNVIFVLPRHGVYKIERSGKVVRSYLDEKVSHDADRLPNGNTLITDASKIAEISPDGEIVWLLKIEKKGP